MNNIMNDITCNIFNNKIISKKFYNFFIKNNDKTKYTDTNKKTILLLYNFFLNEQPDEIKQLNLLKDIKTLKEEINEFIWNVDDIPKNKQKEIIEEFIMLKKSFNNKIFMNDINGYSRYISIRISDRILIDGIDFGSTINNKSTLHFINCDKVTIFIYKKVNHITLEKCNNINIKSIGGSITGLDTISCKNISHIFDNGYINFVDISKSLDCIYYISEQIALNTLISTMESMNLIFYITKESDGCIINKFEKNKSYFDTYKKFLFEQNNNNIIIKDTI